MSKTLKKTLSIILTVLMIATTVPFAFAAETAVPDTVYFDNTSSAWRLVNAYFFDDSYQSVYNNWPGTQMAEAVENIYSIEVPEGALYVVFNDGGTVQTADLTIPTDGANCYDFGTKAWNKFETAEALWGTADNLTFGGTLAEAFLAAQNNSEITYIKLNSDITLSEELYINGGSFTLDINGKTLSLDIDEENIWATPISVLDGTTVVFDDTAAEKGEIISEGVGVQFAYGKGIFKNISITGKSYGIAVLSDATIEIDGAEVTGTDFAGVKPDGTVIMKNGTASGPYAVMLTEGSSAFTMLGGNLEGEQTDIDYWYGTVDLSGNNNPEGITLFNYSGTLNASSISLPYDYHFYDAYGNYQDVLEADETYTIQEHMQTCTSSVCEICNEYIGVREHVDKDENNLCDFCNEFFGIEIKPGDTYTVTKEELVKFVPTVSGIHIISSVSDVDPRVTLYNSNMEYITEEDDSGYREENDFDFYLEYEFTAGETYYFEFYGYNEEYNYTVTVIEPCSVHTGGTQTCKGFKCEVCMQWYGEAGEHTAEGEQTCLGTLCSVCGEYFGEASEHDLSSEQTCLGYYCYSCGDYYGEAAPDAHNWNDTFCDICGDEHDHTGGTQTCKGFKCEICENWYGEAGEQHNLSTEQTCKGYRCNWCYRYFGETGEHSSSTEQTCMGYMCEYCYEWFGEADTSKHSWFYGYCDYCDAEYPVDEECVHDLDNDGECITCGYQCPHEIIEDGACTACFYIMAFSVITGEEITYHTSLYDALDAASDGSTVRLMKNSYGSSVDIEKEIIFDLNGHTYDQPSSYSFNVFADATFTDSVGGGYLHFSVNIYSPCKFEGGSYSSISLGYDYETEDTLEDFLGDCCDYYDDYTGERLDLSGDAYINSGVTVKAEHSLDSQTCKGYKCEGCSGFFGEADPDAHVWRFGECTECGYACEHSFTKYTQTKAPTCTEAGREVSPCDYCDAVDDNEIPETGHDWSNKDGICDACNYVCDHSFTVFNETAAPKCEETGWEESYCDYNCGINLEQEIPALDHDWVSGGVERPTQNIDGAWSDGYYYDTCKNDATHINITGVAKRADYTAYDEAYKALKTEQKNEALTDAGAASVNQAVMTGMTMPQNIIEDEPTTAYLNNWVKNAQSILAKIESGEYVKADYTEIDEAIKAVDEALENATISEEMKAELEDIKTDLEALKENASATMADVNALLDRAEAITETMNNCANGVHFFIAYEEVTAPKCGVAGKEVAACDNGCGETDEKEIPALEHIDENGDYLCDNGCGHEFEKPAEPDIPDEPSDDTCDHLCHKTGFIGFIWKIVRFFQRLFGIQQYCDCGVTHW